MEIVYEAGAVTYRINNNEIEFLIERAKKNPFKWIFPKGHIESGETAELAAVRELEEEAGIIGKNIAFIDTVEILNKGKIYSIKYFLLEYVSTAGAGEVGRDPVWMKSIDAIRKLSFEESKGLINKSGEIIKKRIESFSCSFFQHGE